MNEIALMKEQVNKYLDTADEKVVKMVYAMLEVDAQNDWWDEGKLRSKGLNRKRFKRRTGRKDYIAQRSYEKI